MTTQWLPCEGCGMKPGTNSDCTICRLVSTERDLRAEIKELMNTVDHWKGEADHWKWRCERVRDLIWAALKVADIFRKVDQDSDTP